MNFIIAQLIGIVATVCAVIATQFRTIKAVLWMGIITNLLTALNYMLLGMLSGTWICIVAAVQAIVMDFMNQRTLKTDGKSRLIVLLIFAVIYVIGSVIVFEKWIDIFPCICALIYTLSVYQKDILRYKIISILNPSTWIIYDVATKAYTTVGMRVILIALIGIAIIRIIRERKANTSAYFRKMM